MFRRALSYILVLATVSMACFVMFIQARDVCAELFVEASRPAGEELLQFVGLPQGKTMVVGQYTQGISAGDLSYTIYTPHASRPIHDHFGVDGASITLQQVVPAGNETHLICLVTPRAEDAVSYGAVYVVDQQGAVQEPIYYKEAETDTQYGFNRFVCAGRAYAGIQNQRVTVFDGQGTVLLQLNSEQTREIYDVRYDETGVLIAGCTSESGLKETVHRGFCACYDLEGNCLWRKAVAGEEGNRATVLQILENGEAGWVLYGRYAVEDFSKISAHGIPFRFIAGQASGDHAFLIAMDSDGQLTKQVTYPYTSSYLVSQSLSAESGLLLRAYTAQTEGADRYNVQIVGLDSNLEETNKVDVQVWGDQTFYCAPWAEQAKDGLWVYHAGNVRFYANADTLSGHFTGLMKWRPVCEAALSMRAGALWFLCLYGMMMLCILGICRSPHSQYYGAFCRKKRRV